MEARRLFTTMVSVLSLLTLLPVAGYAVVPTQINYQGYLTDDLGNPLDGTFNIGFSIYDAATGGSSIWSESQAVAVQNGIYNVILGQSGNPLDPDDFDGDLYLEVDVGGEVLSPRQKITATAFALKAATVADGAVTSAMIADDTITAEDLGANCVDTSEIAAQAVGTNQLKHGAVTYLKMADDAVGSAEIVNGSVSGVDVGFNYAGSSSKGGPATDLDCAGCVSQSEVQAPFDLSESSPDPIVEGTNSGTGYGVRGEHSASGNYGYLGGTTVGVHGWGGLAGVRGQGSSGRGVWGITISGDSGVYGEHTTSGNIGYLGGNLYGVYGNSSSGFAGYFEGNVSVSGNLGIGTASPAEKLEIGGNLLFPSDGSNHHILMPDATRSLYIGGDQNYTNPYVIAMWSQSSLRFVTNKTEKLRIDSAGRVGIGIKSPDAKLEVAGDFKASGNVQAGGAFVYSSEKTYYLNIPACAFRKDEWFESQSGVLWCTGSGGEYSYICQGPSYPSVGANAPVYLPEGAKVKGVTFYYYDNDISRSVGFGGYLRRRYYASTSYSEIASASFMYSTPSPNIQSVSTSSVSYIINNQDNHYWVGIGWYVDSISLSQDLRFYGCRIEYELTTLAP